MFGLEGTEQLLQRVSAKYAAPLPLLRERLGIHTASFCMALTTASTASLVTIKPVPSGEDEIRARALVFVAPAPRAAVRGVALRAINAQALNSDGS